MIIYGIKNCDTMKKAFDWLNAHGISYTFHDYKKQGIDSDTLQFFLKTAKLDTLINKKGITFKKLSDSEKAACEKTATALPLLQEKTSMIKRPILRLQKKVLFGFDPEIWESELLK